MPDRRATALLAAALALVLALAPAGCAYFNTFSNAKKYYREAENLPRGPDGDVTPTARKKYDQSITKCQKLMDLYPASGLVDDALLLMSRAYFQKREYGRCLNRLGELDERFPDHEFGEEVLYMRGVCQLENGDESRAIAALTRLADEHPESKHLAEGLFRIGEAEYRLGNWEEAAAAFANLLARVDRGEWNDKARLRIAHALRELDRDEEALAALAELSARGEDRRRIFEGQMLRAEILLDLKRYAECRAIMADILDVAANYQSRPEALLLDARIDEQEGKLDEAIVLLENIAQEFPRSLHAAEAWYRIGLIRQVRHRDLEGAVQAYEQVSRELPRSVFTDLANTKKRAIQEYLDVRAQFGEEAPDSSAAIMQFRLAENQFLRLEDPEAAVPEYRKVLDLYPESSQAPSAAYALCYIYRYSLADTAAALAAVDYLRENYPDSEAAAYVARWPQQLGSAP
ncbi:MAG: tetratricopeptide repeat protein [Candidatus Krumholzibacteriota bacterium]|nr:tetratricopeptide repeat protein [Candidatus Krumholzibacteriota bacterium]